MALMRRLALLPLLLLGAAAQAGENRGPFRKIAIVRLKDDSEEMIDQPLKVSVLRRIEQVREWGADCVVFDIESYGGLVLSSIEAGDEIFALGDGIHTIAYIHRRAISGAAMLSISCREIVMSEAATIGDSQAVYMTAEGLQVAPEKAQTTVASTFEKYAQRNGYPVPLVVAMVRANLEVVRYRKPADPGDPAKGSTWVYYRSDQLPSWAQQEEQFLTDQEVVVPEGELATFPAFKAVEYGLCSRTAPDLQAMLDSIRAPNAEVRTFDWTWAENTSRWLLSIRVWLFLAGAVFAYLAIKMPGTGVPEVLAVLCFGLFFGASAIAGFAGALEVVLFFAGIALLLVEIFVLPGFGVAGFAGLACIFLSIALAALPATGGDVDPATPSYYLVPMARDFIYGALGAVFVAFVIARYLPAVPLFRGLALGAPGAATRGSAATGLPTPAVGARGVTETPLRPAGRARIDGAHHDVVAEGAFVPQGTEVQVVAVRGNVIVVRPGKRA